MAPTKPDVSASMGAEAGQMQKGRPARTTCSECGAELKTGPASCPLCGGSVGTAKKRDPERVSPENYRTKIRELKEQLRKLRDEGVA